MDLSRSIRMAVDTGKVLLGTQSAIKQALTGSPKLIIVSSNAPSGAKADLARYCAKGNVPVLEYTGTSIELGTVCGKPFPISAMAVLEVGNSDILAAGSAAQDSASQ